jgi:hypothetical protein
MNDERLATRSSTRPAPSAPSPRLPARPVAAVPPRDLLRRRLANQRLVGAPPASAAEVVAWLGAVQAQDYAGAKWGVGLRLPQATDSALDRAFDAGAIVRTHVLRPTWHFVAPADLRWLLELTGPRVKARVRPVERRLGLDDDLFRQANAVIARALAGGGSLTRDELATALRGAGVDVPGPAMVHVLGHAELDGLVCSGPRRGKQHTYALLEARVPPGRKRSRDEAVAELAGRYFTSHGPATLGDFAWWSGLTLADARRGVAALGSGLLAEQVNGLEYWLVPGDAPAPFADALCLLPNYDEYTVAYRDRDVYFDAARAPARPGRPSVPFDHAVVSDGRVLGFWRRTLGRDAVAVDVDLFEPTDRNLKPAAARYGRFLGLPVVLNGQPL